jgi:hypothetical protein
MLKNVLLLAALSVGVMAASTHTYHVTLAQNSIVDGHQLKPGSYKVELNNTTAVLRNGKQVVQVPAREETAQNKFANTEVEYTGNNMQKINFGGTHTSIVFAGGNAGAAGSGSASGAASLR